MNTRTAILNGQIELPTQIIDLVGSHKEVAEEFFGAIFYNYLKNKKATNTTYWYDRFGDSRCFNKYLFHLSKAGWINSKVVPNRHWAEVSFNEEKLSKYATRVEIEEMRFQRKFDKYLMTNNEYKATPNTKTAKGTQDVGLVRTGFKESAKTTFKLDVKVLHKYKKYIVKNVIKGIKEMNLDIDIAEYTKVATEVVEYYSYSENEEYCMNGSITDSRGRNIFKGLSKVFNPVGFKDSRALLVTEPKSLGVTGLKAVELFVAELLGYKPSMPGEKQQLGKEAIANKTLLELNLDTEEGRSDLHENMWLERIYSNIESYDGSNWVVPVELDFTASQLAITGMLLNDYKYMDLTNIVGTGFKDAWTIKGVSRNQVKKAVTPKLYGSSASVRTLWNKNKLDFTEEQLAIVDREIKDGRFTLADKFKDFIIANVVPKNEMTVTVGKDTFTIYPNRFRNVGEYAKKYDIYDTDSMCVKTIRHVHTKRVPDLEQFRLYFPTLLVHGLDSQIANAISEKLEWCIDIHDAFVVAPIDANKVRVEALAQMNELYSNRDKILGDFFKSVGINNPVAWTEVRRHTTVVDNLVLTANVLK
jgi:hypothetical protein